jgi:hypothetical protein
VNVEFPDGLIDAVGNILQEKLAEYPEAENVQIIEGERSINGNSLGVIWEGQEYLVMFSVDNV